MANTPMVLPVYRRGRRRRDSVVLPFVLPYKTTRLPQRQAVESPTEFSPLKLETRIPGGVHESEAERSW
jgi:hypothetical protein